MAVRLYKTFSRSSFDKSVPCSHVRCVRRIRTGSGSDWNLSKEHLLLNEVLIQRDPVATAPGSDIDSRVYSLFERCR
jgi:hypothetical protein